MASRKIINSGTASRMWPISWLTVFMIYAGVSIWSALPVISDFLAIFNETWTIDLRRVMPDQTSSELFQEISRLAATFDEPVYIEWEEFRLIADFIRESEDNSYMLLEGFLEKHLMIRRVFTQTLRPGALVLHLAPQRISVADKMEASTEHFYITRL